MNIQSKILAVTIPLIIFPLILISLMSTKTANDGIINIAKDLLSFKLEEIYKNVSYQYDLLQETNLLNDKEMFEKTLKGIEEYSKTIKLSKTGYIEIIDREGNIIISPQNKGLNISNNELFNKLKSSDFGWIEYNFKNSKRVGMYILFS